MGALGNTIIHHDFLWLSLAVYMGALLQDFFGALSKDIIVPFMDGMFNFDAKFDTYSFNWRGQTFKYGDIVIQLFNLIVGLTFVLSVVWALKHL